MHERFVQVSTDIDQRTSRMCLTSDLDISYETSVRKDCHC